MPKADNKTLRDAYEEWRRLDQEVTAHADALAARGVTSSEIEDDIMQRYGRSHDWAVALFQPIADALVESGCFDRVEVIGPQGVGAVVALFAYNGVGCINPAATVYFRPDLSLMGDSCLRVLDLEGDTGEYAPGSKGQLHGLHLPAAPVPMDTRINDVGYWRGLMRSLT